MPWRKRTPQPLCLQVPIPLLRAEDSGYNLNKYQRNQFMLTGWLICVGPVFMDCYNYSVDGYFALFYPEGGSLEL